MNKKLILLVRAYNDLDCRLPVLMEFAEKGNYDIFIIGIPTNNGISDLRNHELLAVLGDLGIHYQTIFDLNKRYIPNILFWIYSLFQPRKGIAGKISNKIKQKLFKIIVFISYRSNYWFEDIIKSFDKSIIIIDEVVFQKNRSFFVDELIEHKDHFSIYSFILSADNLNNMSFSESYTLI